MTSEDHTVLSDAKLLTSFARSALSICANCCMPAAASVYKECCVLHSNSSRIHVFDVLQILHDKVLCVLETHSQL